MLRWLYNRVLGTSEPVRLHVMRASDMLVVHPNTDWTHFCSNCLEPVGIYPSGQEIIRRHQDVEIICQRCTNPSLDELRLAPGAMEERDV